MIGTGVSGVQVFAAEEGESMAHVYIYSARHVPLSARELDSSIAPHCATLQHSATDTNVICHAHELEPSAAAAAAATRAIAAGVVGENYSVATFCTGNVSTKSPHPRARVRTLSLSFSCAPALSFPRSFLSLPLPVSFSVFLSHGGGRSGRERGTAPPPSAQVTFRNISLGVLSRLL